MSETWLVGGAVRDELLGLPVHERDWVVVGSTPEEMEAAGFRRVGRDFPVFLHPRTGEEYALARTERKAGHGYHGFEVHAGRDVTLEDDLRRRDLTINAIARAADGTLFDPCGGRADLQARRLRHVSPAFREDPLRVLRVARFAARFAPLGFEVAPETRELMAAMVADGELAWLVPERVWQETATALGEPAPQRYFDELAACGALAVVMPELAGHWGEDRGHARAALREAAAGTDIAVRLAAACHELAPERELDRLFERLPAPRRVATLTATVARGWPAFARLAPTDGDAAWSLLRACDGLRRPAEFDSALAAWEAAARARGDDPDDRLAALRLARTVADGLRGRDLAAEGFSGSALGEELDRRRRERVRRRLADSGRNDAQGSQ